MLRRITAAGVALLLVLSAGQETLAGEHLPQFGRVDTVEMLFFPFLPNGDTIDSTGPWYGSVTVQNLEDDDVRIWAFPDAGFNPDESLGTWMLPPRGAITLSSGALGLEHPGSPVVIAGMFRSIYDAGSDPENVDSAIFEACGFGPDTLPHDTSWSRTCKPAISGVAKLTTPDPGAGATGNRTDDNHLMVDGYNGIPAQDVAWGAQSRFCEAIVAKWDDDCSGVGTYEPLGYGVGFVFDGHSYLPIVQTNSDWNTEIRISNVDPSAWAGQVNVTLIASNSQGHAASEDDQISFETTLRPGHSWSLNLRDHGVPENWVGSAHITSSVGVVAQALRINTRRSMLMTNVAAPSTWSTTSRGTELQSTNAATYHVTDDGEYRMYAPLVFRDYNGWNTGISIANIDEASARVTLNFHDMNGSLGSVRTRTIPAQSQEYVYIPADPGSREPLFEGQVGAVSLSADVPFHATVDQVKYSTGEAMSYMATAAGIWASDNPQAPDLTAHTLALPLVQKGNKDGTGDTSGIQLFNPDTEGWAEIEVTFHSQIGDRLPPTDFAPIRATVPAGGGYTVYAMGLSGMIPRTSGTATVEVVGGTGQIVAASNNVNYAIDGDGSTALNLVNNWGQYRFPVSQTE